MKILAECEAPDASVAKVALRHGINANIVFAPALTNGILGLR